MLKVMLVDDKKSIIDGLEMLIDWQDLGYEVAAKTVSAKEAIDIAKSQKIDLVITDIRMPEMSGMDMITQISEVSPDTRFVFESAYSEFEYAKWAVDRQIDGYIIKPIDEQELISILQRIKVEIEKSNKTIMRNINSIFMNVLLGNDISGSDADTLNLDMKLRYVVIKEAETEIFSSKQTQSASDSWATAIDFIEAYNKDKGICLAMKNATDEVEMIIEDTGDAKEYITGIRQGLNKLGVSKFVILIGQRSDGLGQLEQAKKSMNVLEDAMFYENEQVLMFEDYKHITYSEHISNMEIIRKITDEINTPGSRAAQEFREIILKERVRPKVVGEYINKIIFDMIDRLGIDENEIMPILYRWSILKKNNYITLDILYNFLSEITEEVRGILAAIKKKQKIGVIGDIVQYIEENYSDKELNLQSVAKRFFFRPAYFGKVFKEKTGVSFNDYLMHVRIKEAKNLLKTTEHKVYEIAFMVGFADSNYFYTKFRELEGTSPANYRENTKMTI